MNSYQLIVNNTILDTDNEFDFSINYLIDDILDISARNTSWTRTIVLKGTAENNRFFSMLYDVNITSLTFNPVKRLPAIIRVGAEDVLTGWMQLNKIVNVNKEISYEVSIAGNLKNIISNLSDHNLSELNFSEYNHLRTSENIVKSWNYNIFENNVEKTYFEGGNGYVYPYIINGNTQDIWSSIYTFDSYPALYLKTVMDKILNFAGVTYTSNFLNSPYFKKLILTFSGDKIQMSEEELDTKKVIAGIDPSIEYVVATPIKYRTDNEWYYSNVDNYPLGFTRESGTVDDVSGELTFRDDLSQFDGNHFVVANVGRYDISFDGTFIATYNHDDGDDVEFKEGEFEYRYQMFLIKTNGSVLLLDSSVNESDPNDTFGVQKFQPSSGVHPTPWTDVNQPLAINLIAENVFMEPGDKVVVRYGFNYPGNIEWFGLLNDNKISAKLNFKRVLDSTFSKFTAVPASNQSYSDDLINMNQVLDGNRKISDLFLDVVKTFDLIIMDNPNKKDDLIIEPRVDFYRSKQLVLDWDKEEKLDYDSPIIITPMSEIDSKAYLYTYSSDDDWLNKDYSDESKRVYGDLKIEVENDFSDKTSKTELGFAATPSGQKFIDSRVAPFFVEYDGETFKPKKVKQRLLFYSGPVDLYSGSTITVKNYPEDLSGITVNQYAYTGMWDAPNGEALYSLEFGRPDKMFFDSDDKYPNQNLYEMYHKPTLNNIIDKDAKMLECTVKLSPTDIANFDFRDIVFLLGSYWRVMRIEDYSPLNANTLTKVTLYKIVDINIISKYQVEIPISNKSCPVDLITIKVGKRAGIIVSKSGQQISEDCCKQVGGNWNNGTCSISRGKDRIPGIAAITGGLGNVPTSDSKGPVVIDKNGNTINSIEAKVFGSGNYVPGGTRNTFIAGSNNSIQKNVFNSYILGDNIIADQNNTLYAPENLVLSGANPSINSIPFSALTASTWADVLANGNTSGPNDAIMDSGQVISSSNGGGQLALDYLGSASEVVLSTDTGALAESYLYLSQGTIQLESGNGSNISLGDAVVITSTAFDAVTIDTGIEGFNINTRYNNVSVGNAIFFKDNFSSAVTSANNLLPSILIGTRNSTVNSGITNSVAIGGSGLTATQNDTVYVPFLNIRDLSPTSGVTNLAIDANGNVVSGGALTGTTATWSQVLSNGNASGGNNVNITNGDKIIADDGGTIIIEAADTINGVSSIYTLTPGLTTHTVSEPIVGDFTTISQSTFKIDIGSVNTINGTVSNSSYAPNVSTHKTEDLNTGEFSEIEIGINNIELTAFNGGTGEISNIIQTPQSISQVVDLDGTNAEMAEINIFSNFVGEPAVTLNSYNASADANILIRPSSILNSISNNSGEITSIVITPTLITYTEYNEIKNKQNVVTTTNATVTNLTTYSPSLVTPGAFTVEYDVYGFEPATGNAIGAKALAVFKIVGGVVIQVAGTTLDRKSNFPGAVTVIVDTDGTIVRFRVQGQAGRTINWKGGYVINN